MKTIEINEINKYLDAAPNEMCLMLIGDTGIGKTTVVSNYAKENGYYFKTLVLSQLRADEALGIPVQDKRIVDGKEYNVLTTAIPEWVLDLHQHKKSLLFLDEFLTAKPDVMNTFLNFLTERNVNGMDLSHVKIVAATNIGMYSFQPDINILSRFCMFYTINTSYNSFINDDRIINDYEDETNKEHVVFDPRSLKPRCQYLLSFIKDDELLDDFYQGFTNKRLSPLFFNDKKLNKFLTNMYNTQKNNKGFVEINKDNIGLFIQFITSEFPRIKDITKTVNAFEDTVHYQKEIDGVPFIEFVNLRLDF